MILFLENIIQYSSSIFLVICRHNIAWWTIFSSHSNHRSEAKHEPVRFLVLPQVHDLNLTGAPVESSALLSHHLEDRLNPILNRDNVPTD